MIRRIFAAALIWGIGCTEVIVAPDCELVRKESLDETCAVNRVLRDSLLALAAVNREHGQLSRAQELEERAGEILLCETD
ncbi:MAG: hypothetical protein OXM01_13965 [Gemmatimonadota bacterium]|nr:hypothetical protein [Gemmatimonadota bacterium]